MVNPLRIVKARATAAEPRTCFFCEATIAAGAACACLAYGDGDDDGRRGPVCGACASADVRDLRNVLVERARRFEDHALDLRMVARELVVP